MRVETELIVDIVNEILEFVSVSAGLLKKEIGVELLANDLPNSLDVEETLEAVSVLLLELLASLQEKRAVNSRKDIIVFSLKLLMMRVTDLIYDIF